MNPLIALDAGGLLDRFRSGELDPVDAVAASIAQMDRTEPMINAVLARRDEEALADADRSAERYRTGTARPLEGLPIGVKDIIDVAGMPTTGGSKIYRDRIPDRDATVVARLRAAGAVVVAKHAAFSFALGHERDGDFGATLNPWDLARTPGGSSSGSGAAVAARQVPVSIGSDTGGSIRVPAAWCGISGLKPTFGRVPTRGVIPLAWSMDTVGPLARSVGDLALVLDTIADDRTAAGAQPREGRGPHAAVLERGVDGLRIGVPTSWFMERCDPDIVAAVDDAARRFAAAGASIVEVEVPHADLSQPVGWFTMLAELASLHEINLDRIDDYDAGFRGHIANGAFVAASDYARCLRLRSLIQSDYEIAFATCDALLVPGNASYAPRLDDMLCQVGDEHVFWYEVAARCTFSFNITGMPAVAVPAGLGSNGLPLGIQIAGPPFAEATILRVAAAFEQQTAHRHLAPAMADG